MNHIHDAKALELSREVMALVYDPMPIGGSVQLQAKIQCLFVDAMEFAGTRVSDGWIPVSERMPERDVDEQVYCADKKEQMVGYMERNETEGWFRFASLPNGGGVYCKPTHWMPLPAPPQQEV